MSHPYSFALHETLLRVAGWLPDELLASARSLLADDRCGEVAEVLAFAGRRTVLPLSEDDLDTLTELLESDGVSPEVLHAVELAPHNTPLLWRFSAEWHEVDLQEGEGENSPMTVAAFAAEDLLAAVEEEPGMRALWSAVRRPVGGARYPRPRVVYVAEVDDEESGTAELPELVGRIQARLIAAGERDPQVELLSVRSSWPDYQLAVRVEGKLLWSAAGDVEIKVARIFDEVDPETGPRFEPDRAKITDEDTRNALISYLGSGTALLVTTAMLEDVVDTAQGAVVPTSFRTDGTWVWTDAVAYYLEHHQLAPDPELVAHIEAAGGPPSAVDSVALGRAMEALKSSRDDRPVWTTS
ncbi:hypothetical protein [Amycolatopsis speibonae]|uniref:Uncharacterized protein n=1 Tax=Amycolatopsis speibonae TaxID=1450224 RepID=A0ABV7P0K6_9PSEU